MGLMDLFGKKKKPAESPAEKSARLRAEAMENARAARERLGEDTIQKIAAALGEQSAGKKAQRELQAMDKAQIADHLKIMIGDDDK